MPSPFLLPVILILFSLLSPSSAKPITLSLTRTAVIHRSSSTINTDLWQRLYNHALASSARADHLKRCKTTTVKTPLFARSGYYSVSLSFGTPPQHLKFLMDTGSSFVWFPCTLPGQKYSCIDCNTTSKPADIPTFKPALSSSSKNFSCESPQCKWLLPTDFQCNACEKNSSRPCYKSCPITKYTIGYGSGNTTGRILSESLTFPEMRVDNFLAGCSVSSAHQPEGVVGFGRAPESLPSQMNLKRFSYCLVSHNFDDNTTVSSDLVLNGPSEDKGAKIQYTPFMKNPNIPSHPAYLEYYYLNLQKFIVGGVDVKVPYKYLVPDASGNGGTLVDSGTTVTIMEKPVFDLVEKELLKQVGKNKNYTRDKNSEEKSGLSLCFKVSGDQSLSHFPKLSLAFEGDAIMDLPLENYVVQVDDSVICMIMIASVPGSRIASLGPAIILGNYLQQNFHVEYDLNKNRFGFRSQNCDEVN